MKMVRLLLVALLAAAVSLIVPTAHAETGQLLPAEVSEKGTEHTQTILNKVNNLDRKSTRLNSSHQLISYAVFCLKKKTSYR